MKKALALSILVLALGGCATDEGAPAKSAAAAGDYDQLNKQAKDEIALAKKSGFLWNNTEKFLKESEEAKKAGDMDKAMKLANKALKEAKLAQQQAKDQANPKPDFTFKN